MKIDIEKWDKIMGLIFKIAIIFGGLILFFYCMGIGYFPTDISVGDGFQFLLLAVLFVLIQMLFAASLTSLGLLVLKILDVSKLIKLYELAYKKLLKNEGQENKIVILKFDFITFMCVFVLAFLSPIFFNRLGVNEEPLIYILLSIFSISSAILYSNQQQNTLERKNLELKENLNDLETKRLCHLKSVRVVPIITIILTFLFFTIFSANFINLVMSKANVRSESVSVHIKKPYVYFAEEYGIGGEKSVFGSDFKKFKESNVLLTGYGKNTVVELKTNKNTFQKLIIPSDHVYIINW